MKKNKHDTNNHLSVSRLNIFKEVTNDEKKEIQKESIINTKNIIIEDTGKDLCK